MHAPTSHLLHDENGRPPKLPRFPNDLSRYNTIKRVLAISIRGLLVASDKVHQINIRPTDSSLTYSYNSLFDIPNLRLDLSRSARKEKAVGYPLPTTHTQLSSRGPVSLRASCFPLLGPLYSLGTSGTILEALCLYSANSASRLLVHFSTHHPASHSVSESAVLAYLNLLHIRRIKRGIAFGACLFLPATYMFFLSRPALCSKF